VLCFIRLFIAAYKRSKCVCVRARLESSHAKVYGAEMLPHLH
jgi:hypothetical protein